ncbi:MAG TPA: hypothetical protein VHB79_04660 [Polyangiaceae bacterium]|nr:hypothetical protein [Polyangiaceae bacterium]
MPDAGGGGATQSSRAYQRLFAAAITSGRKYVLRTDMMYRLG